MLSFSLSSKGKKYIQRHALANDVVLSAAFWNVCSGGCDCRRHRGAAPRPCPRSDEGETAHGCSLVVFRSRPQGRVRLLFRHALFSRWALRQSEHVAGKMDFFSARLRARGRGADQDDDALIDNGTRNQSFFFLPPPPPSKKKYTSPPARTRWTSTPGAPGPGSTSISSPVGCLSTRESKKELEAREKATRGRRRPNPPSSPLAPASREASSPRGPRPPSRQPARSSSSRRGSRSRCRARTCRSWCCRPRRRWTRRPRRPRRPPPRTTPPPGRKGSGACPATPRTSRSSRRDWASSGAMSRRTRSSGSARRAG